MPSLRAMIAILMEERREMCWGGRTGSSLGDAPAGSGLTPERPSISLDGDRGGRLDRSVQLIDRGEFTARPHRSRLTFTGVMKRTLL